jgi:hypothetical protein
VSLNGVELGQVEREGPPGRFDVTGQLEDRNEVWVDFVRQPKDTTSGPLWPTGTATVVCLEIGTRGRATD